MSSLQMTALLTLFMVPIFGYFMIELVFVVPLRAFYMDNAICLCKKLNAMK